MRLKQVVPVKQPAFFKLFNFYIMPRIKRNTLIKGASGNYRREYVYKVRGDDTFIAGMPEIDRKKPKTARQKTFRQISISAQAYAKAAMADLELKKYYNTRISRSNSAFNVAFQDFQKKPYVDEIKTTGYTGVAGSLIAVAAYDDCKVTGVTVRIISAAGVLIEEGQAIVNNFMGGLWIYTTTQNNPVLAGTKIRATCKDLPQNEGFKEVTL